VFPTAFDDKEERRVMRLTWKVLLLAVVLSLEQIEYRKKGESCALTFTKQRNPTSIEKKKILE
jgi:hypothetical protein